MNREIDLNVSLRRNQCDTLGNNRSPPGSKHFLEKRKRAKRKTVQDAGTTRKSFIEIDFGKISDSRLSNNIDWTYKSDRMMFGDLQLTSVMRIANDEHLPNINFINKLTNVRRDRQCIDNKSNLRFKESIRIGGSEYLRTWFIFFIHFLLVFQLSAAQDDLRCFLDKGGSIQNFFVPENLALGSVIGTLNIRGDASESGDIYLRLEDPHSPVQISINSKNLTLVGKLDKEGKNGKSHVLNTVNCRKRHSIEDVETKIPINIRVTDVNDNAPIFIGAPYRIRLSEATVVGTEIKGDIAAVDNDQNGPYSTVQYSIAAGFNSDKFSFESPISGSLQLRKPLDYELSSLFNLTIVAEDQGSPPQRSETFITVEVLDSDDQNPAFTRQRYMSFLPDKPRKGTPVEIQPEQLRADDQDKGIRARIYYTLGSGLSEASFFSIDPSTGIVTLAEDIEEGFITQPVALSVTATQVDNEDRKASSILTISQRGTSSTQLQFLQRTYDVSVLENLPTNSVITATFINIKPLKNTRFSLERGGMGIFRISREGVVVLDHKLDYETRKEYNIHIYVTDGEYNDTATLKVNVLNVNDWDPRFEFPQYVFYVHKNTVEPGDVVGNVIVADGDRDHISLAAIGRDSRMFDVNSKGEILIRRFIELNSTEAHLVIVAKDTGQPPRQTSVPVTIHFPEGMVKSSLLQSTSSFLLMVVFGSLVAVFILVIICLAVYIHKNKKFRDDNDAALPTKMSQIITSNGAQSKLDPLSQIRHHRNISDNQSDITGIENPRSTGSVLETNNAFQRSYNNDSFRASTISVQSNAENSNQGSRRYLRNPLALGTNLGDGADSLSLNGSNGTTASTATVGSDSPPNIGSRSSTPSAMTRLFGKTSSVAPVTGSISSFCTVDGTARATGGLPPQMRVAPTPPAPPLPPSSINMRGGFDGNSAFTLHRKVTAPQPPVGSTASKKIIWPTEAIPKKVKKLSWEDEKTNSHTELNPEVSVLPMPSNVSKDSPNLTVYF